MDSPEDEPPSSKTAEDEIHVEAIKRESESYWRKRRNVRLRQIEGVLWLFAAISFYLFTLFTRANSSNRTPSDLLIHSLPELSIATLVLLFPVTVYLVFQKFPIEVIRSRAEAIGAPRSQRVIYVSRTADSPFVVPTGTKLSPAVTLEMLGKIADASGKLADKLYTRAGVYLLIGVMIAFSGLAFFYVQHQNTMAAIRYSAVEQSAREAIEAKSLWGGFPQMAPALLGGFGVLFFIELVAFFFLRQYRAAMDEHRYFESIKRRREENVALATIFFQLPVDKIDFFAFVEKCSLYSDVPKLASGETTEMLETRKLTKDEAALFEKMIDVVTRSKS